MKKLVKRHWALYSLGAGAGKTTFLGSNARRPLIVVDTDGRFDAVSELAEGEVLYPKQFIEPLALSEELTRLVLSQDISSLAFDSLTKLYSIHARVGYMRARAGKSKNKATEMIAKANAMAVARDLAVLGTDIYYCWHQTKGLSGSGDREVRDMISGIELARLDTSINVWLEFIREKDRFGIKVDKARDYGGRPANTGFVMWDALGNYWRGGAERLERLIYTSFASKKEAVSWGADGTGLEYDEAEGLYDNLKHDVNPKTTAEMWVAWIEHVDEVARTKIEKAIDETKRAPDPVQVVQDKNPPASPVEKAKPAKIDELRKGLNHKGVTIGKVVYAAATVHDDMNRVDRYLLQLQDYPFTAEQQEVINKGNFTIEMSQKLSGETAQIIFDWLVKEFEPIEEVKLAEEVKEAAAEQETLL